MQCQHCCWFICHISGPFSRPQFPMRIFLTDLHGLQWIRPLGTEMMAQLASACRLHSELCCKIFVKKRPQSSGFWGEEEQVQPAQTVSLFTWSNCRVQAARISYNFISSSLCKEILFDKPSPFSSANFPQISPNSLLHHIMHVLSRLCSPAKFLLLSHLL